ncbi:MAG: carbon storage regulator [Candidatus Rokuibacteriota bacterium]|nr:MAG: carbon storage regulator [Candidatus Rokubacteria bacterium]
MLVLTRRIGERLRIGADIELVVLDVRGRDVRLGVNAPSSVAIHREEIYLKIQDNNRAAALGQPGLTDALARAARELRLRKPEPQAKDGTQCARPSVH